MTDIKIDSPELGDVSNYLRDRIRTVPDWPLPGVQFRDITPLLRDPKTLRVLVDVFVHRYMDARLDTVAGIDARGFILGAIVAYELNTGFVPIRKKGKLPYQTVAEEYELEYGSATVEIHADACKRGDRVLLIDDLIATGGTMMAGRKLLERLGGVVVEGRPSSTCPSWAARACCAMPACRCSRCAASTATDASAGARTVSRAPDRHTRPIRRSPLPEPFPMPDLLLFLITSVAITVARAGQSPVLARGMAQGRRAGVAAGLGFASGCLVHTVVAAVGWPPCCVRLRWCSRPSSWPARPTVWLGVRPCARAVRWPAAWTAPPCRSARCSARACWPT